MAVHRMDPKTVTKVWKCTDSIFNKFVIEMTLKWIIIDASSFLLYIEWIKFIAHSSSFWSVWTGKVFH